MTFKPFNFFSMKSFAVLVFALMSTYVSAQKLAENEIDEFTGIAQKMTDLYILGKGEGLAHGVAFNIAQTVGLYLFTTADIGCVGTPRSRIIFLFSDGTKTAEIVDHASIDCADDATQIFILNPKDFAGKVITKMRIYRSEGYDDVTWDGPYTLQQLLAAVK